MYICAQTATLGSVSAFSDAELEGDPSTALIACAGDVGRDRVLILGHSAPSIMWTLIRHGCVSATELGHGDRPDAHTADLAIVPNVGALDDVALIIRHAKRALVAAGRIVLCTAAAPSGRLVRGISIMLRQQGFSAIRWRRDGARAVVSAALTGFGPLTHA
jgi:hypothetical protein